ncbi:MAG: hypothetical protein U9N87_11470 [Planctomycetota bacterium]|nr:hypothetical protein [Planctomycetota bacterium]
MIELIPRSTSFGTFCGAFKTRNQAIVLAAIMAAALGVSSGTTTLAASGDQSPPASGPAAFTPVGPVTEIKPVAKINPASPVPQEGILVLRGGPVLHGKISRVGDRYHVVMPYGEVVVRTVEVESFCRTLDEAYRLKRSLMRGVNGYGGNVHGHIDLADWCLRNNLLDAVATELADAMAADPRNPMIAHLERRLQAALNPPILHGKGGGHHLPERPEGCSAQMVPDTFSMPSRDELDRLARAMPPGGMETFTATIQPLLVNSCSTHDCHGPRAESEFRLLRANSGRAPSRRLTQRNLHAVMQWIDSENPMASPLLTRPIEPHGLKRTAIFDKTNVDQYRELVDWVSSLSVDAALQRPATVDHKPGVAKQGEVRQAAHVTPWPASARPDSVTKGVKRAVFETPLQQGKNAETNPPSVEHAEVAQPQTERKPSNPTPVDPFDPAIFNQRYLPDE